jgi:hypothetical protein
MEGREERAGGAGGGNETSGIGVALDDLSTLESAKNEGLEVASTDVGFLDI